MPKRKFKILFFSGEILYCLILFIFLPPLIIRTRPDVYNLLHDQEFTIDSSVVYKQPITVTKNHFNSVSLLLKNPATENRQNFTLELGLPDGRVLRQLKFNGYNVGDPAWIPFKFSPIPDSAGITYELRLQTIDPPKNQITAFTDSSTGSFVYRTTVSSGNFLESFKDNLSEQRQQLQSRHPVFSVLFLILIIGLNMALFRS